MQNKISKALSEVVKLKGGVAGRFIVSYSPVKGEIGSKCISLTLPELAELLMLALKGERT